MVVPLFVVEKSTCLEEAMANGKDVLAAQKRAKTNDPTPEDFKVGTVGTIIQLLRLPDGTVKVPIEANVVRIESFLETESCFGCNVAIEELSRSPRLGH